VYGEITVMAANLLITMMECATASPMALEKELETFKRELPNLLRMEGRFAVICGDTITGVYVSYEDALKVGDEPCGLSPFLVKKIQAFEQVQYFTRDLDFACHT
jgi:hypothetical protein